ncbi:phage tail assembly chaperone [Pseudomonas atacamensis]|uniref:phage tail assembly chaperone n=1 Tax=Pseudomonas atacamensis TaxID=2565368 RepID=UPI0021609460|nr:phage tail assembly chaperone [Pseudomonas atacamensis]UVL97950.1 phage tail assembly chaperone [Pseudomonas atacamensis]
MYFSKTTEGFYDSAIHAVMPKDVVEITAAEHAELMAGQANGKLISCGENGYPLLLDPPPVSDEVLVLYERAWRDGQLSATDGVVSRHRDELEDAQETTLTTEEYSELQAYRRALRNWPEAGEFPLTDHRPSPPSWLAEQIQ